MRKIPRKNCRNCNKECSRPEKVYCNSNCCAEYKVKHKVQYWLSGKDKGYATNGQLRPYIRKYLISQANNTCSECGWDKIHPKTNKSTLEIHHKDGNYKNNSIDNLVVLCPNCHSLTDSHKNLNKGNGRDCRK